MRQPARKARPRSGAARPAPARARPLDPAINLHDLEDRARRVVSPMAYDYVAGGSGDEVTLRSNRDAWERLRLAPRVLVDVGAVDTRLDLLGRPLPFPILLAPTAFQRLLHPEGEIATARAAGGAGALLIVSTVATTALEAVAAAATGRVWFQLYLQRDRGVTLSLLERAEAAGYEAICVTVDTPVLGSRDREKRGGFALPRGLSLANLPSLGDYTAQRHHDPDSIYNPFLDASADWSTIEWLRAHTRLPVVLKGVLVAEDARLAMEHGAAAIIVSNHGGRCLDAVPATAEALPRVVDEVGGRIPVLVDGGIRRGTDVVKALAIGARAVLIGRPYLWGLGSGGESGVRAAIEMLRHELEAAMAQCGLPRLASIGREALWRA